MNRRRLILILQAVQLSAFVFCFGQTETNAPLTQPQPLPGATVPATDSPTIPTGPAIGDQVPQSTPPAETIPSGTTNIQNNIQPGVTNQVGVAPSTTNLGPQNVLLLRQPRMPVISAEEGQERLRRHRAERIKNLGFDVDWTEFDSSELLDIELRIRKAQELKLLGYEANWRYETLSELTDKEQRIKKAEQLERMGVSVNWMSTSLEEMNDFESRIRRARRLQQLGRDVDWREYTISQLSQMEIAILRNRSRW